MNSTFILLVKVTTLSAIALVSIFACTQGGDALGQHWPNVTRMHSQVTCLDGTCLHVTAFQRRKLYVPRSTMKPKVIERQVQRKHAHQRPGSVPTEHAVHLYYAVDTLSHAECHGCQLSDMLDLILKEYGQPAHVATYEPGAPGRSIDVLEQDEIKPFLRGFSAQ